MKHDRQLVEDEDYVVVEAQPAYKYMGGPGEGNIRKSRSAIGIYCPEVSDEVIYLCRECRQYTARTVNGIHSHQQVHRNAERKTTAVTVNDQMVLRSIAFGMLPEKLQKQMLTKARAITGGA